MIYAPETPVDQAAKVRLALSPSLILTLSQDFFKSTVNKSKAQSLLLETQTKTSAVFCLAMDLIKCIM